MTLRRLWKKKLPELMHAMTNANVSSAINSQYRSNLLVVRTLANPVTKKSPSDSSDIGGTVLSLYYTEESPDREGTPQRKALMGVILWKP